MYQHITECMSGISQKKRLNPSFILLLLTLIFFMAMKDALATNGILNITTNTNLSEKHIGNIIIAVDNVRLNCRGYNVVSPTPGSGIGINLDNRTGVIIKKCHVKDFYMGFSLNSSSYNKLKNNSVVNNTTGTFGFRLVNAYHNKLKNNVVSNLSFSGFELIIGSDNNRLSRNQAINSATSFYLASMSSDNTLKKNVAQYNNFAGYYISDSSGTPLRNTLKKNKSLDSIGNLCGCGFRILGMDSRVENNLSSGNKYGFNIHTQDSHYVENESIFNSIDGFRITAGSGNIFEENQVNNNTENGFYFLSEAKNNIVEDNTSKDNSDWGILDESNDSGTSGTANTYDDNECTGNGIGASSPVALC